MDVNEVEASSLLGGAARSFLIDGERVDDALVVGLGSDWIKLQVPDKRGGLPDPEGPRRPRIRWESLDDVELLPKSEAAVSPRDLNRIGSHPTAKPQTSDQAPGEEVVQVNDNYRGGEPAPDMKQEEQAQHQTGG